MKNSKPKSAPIMCLVILLFTNSVYAQWGLIGAEGHTNTSVSKIGVGNFPSAAAILSALHVDGNRTATTTGEVVRSDCPQDISTYWRQLRGGVEHGVVYSLSPSDDYTGTTTGEGHHFYIQSSYRDLDGLAGDLRFNTGGPNPRMRILGVNGFTGFGDYTAFRPQNLVHLHDNINETNSTYAQWTNPTSNANF